MTSTSKPAVASTARTTCVEFPAVAEAPPDVAFVAAFSGAQQRFEFEKAGAEPVELLAA